MRACRTCLSKHDLYPLFGELELSSDQLFLTTGIKISPDDGLPQTACITCVKLITNSLYLRELSSKSAQYFKTVFEHNVKSESIIDNVDTDPFDESHENSYNFIQHAQTNDINDSNVINESNDVNDYDSDNVSDDDTKPIIENNDTTISSNQLYETEFVTVQTKEENAEYGRDENTETRNCITLSKDAQIMLYPTKDGENIPIITKDPIEHLIQDSTLPHGQSNIIDKANKKTTPKNLKYIIKCNADNIYNCKSEICQTILKNKLQKDSANASQTSNVCSQSAKVSCQLATTSGHTNHQANISGQTITVSCQTVNIKPNQSANVFNQPDLASGQTANISGQTANISSQTANISGQTANISGQTANISGQTVNLQSQLCKIRIEDFISREEWHELFKDTCKFGKKEIASRKAKSCQKNDISGETVSKFYEDLLNEELISKDGKSVRDDDVRLLENHGISDEQKIQDVEVVDYDNQFGILMSKLKENFVNYVPKDTEESKVIKKIDNIIKPCKMDSARRQFFKERNAKLMSLAVTPYKDPGPIQCSVCNDVVQHKHSFRNHAMKHFKKQYVCQVGGCGKEFVHRGQLCHHEQRHHGVEKRFSCAQCHYRAADRLAMKNHVRAEHTGEKPFECNECGAKFRMRNNIRQHMLVHFRPTKNIQCEYCPALVQCRRDLWMHQDKAHFYTYKYYCYLCANTYKSGCSTRKHLLKVHGVPKDQQLKIRRDKIRKTDAPSLSNFKTR